MLKRILEQLTKGQLVQLVDGRIQVCVDGAWHQLSVRGEGACYIHSATRGGTVDLPGLRHVSGYAIIGSQSEPTIPEVAVSDAFEAHLESVMRPDDVITVRRQGEVVTGMYIKRGGKIL